MAVFNVLFALAVVLLLVVGVGWWLLQLMGCMWPRKLSATDPALLLLTGTIHIRSQAQIQTQSQSEPVPDAEPVPPVGGPYPPGRRIGYID